MYNSMIFPATVDEFMEEYKVVDSEHVYSNGMEMVPIFRMKQWFEHEANHNAELGKMVDDTVSRQAAMEGLMAKNIIMDGSEYHNGFNAGVNRAQEVIRNLPPVQPDTSELINRIRMEINSKNRNSADYFIVDRIESILNEWEKEHGKADAIKWIPFTTESAPKEDGEYFVLYDDKYAEDYDTGRVGVADFYGDCEAFGYWQERYDPVSLGFVDSDFIEIKVKKWMPIPKEEGEQHDFMD